MRRQRNRFVPQAPSRRPGRTPDGGPQGSLAYVPVPEAAERGADRDRQAEHRREWVAAAEALLNRIDDALQRGRFSIVATTVPPRTFRARKPLGGSPSPTRHHCGAGTTTAAARAGAPQVVPSTPTCDALSAAVETALTRETRTRARTVAGTIRTDGTTAAEKPLLDAGRPVRAARVRGNHTESSPRRSGGHDRHRCGGRGSGSCPMTWPPRRRLRMAITREDGRGLEFIARTMTSASVGQAVQGDKVGSRFHRRR